MLVNILGKTLRLSKIFTSNDELVAGICTGVQDVRLELLHSENTAPGHEPGLVSDLELERQDKIILPDPGGEHLLPVGDGQPDALDDSLGTGEVRSSRRVARPGLPARSWIVNRVLRYKYEP